LGCAGPEIEREHWEVKERASRIPISQLSITVVAGETRTCEPELIAD